MSTKSEQTFKLSGIVGTWNLGNPARPRKWTCIDLPFGVFRRWAFMDEYKDKTGKGWQRKQTPRHIKNLRNDMEADLYTPAIFSGGLMPSTERSLNYWRDGDDEMVDIHLTPQAKLPCIDGGHRFHALEMLLMEAIEAANETLVATIENLTITIQIYLDSKHLKTDFMNLQKGKSMDRNQLKSMEGQSGQIHPDKVPYFQLANAVIHALHENPKSHLCGQIQYDSTTVNKIKYASMMSDQASDLVTTVWGGARIALAYARNEAWLEQTYCEMWQAVSHSKDPQKRPDYLGNGCMLQPSLWGGKRGATHFLVGVANMLAYRKAFFGREKATENDLSLLRQIAEDQLTGPSIGWSGDDKRVRARQFADAFFADIVLQPGDKPQEGKVVGYQGVPAPLVETLSAGAFKIAREYLPGKGPKRDELILPRSSVEEMAKKIGKAKTKSLAGAGHP